MMNKGRYTKLIMIFVVVVIGFVFAVSSLGPLFIGLGNVNMNIGEVKSMSSSIVLVYYFFGMFMGGIFGAVITVIIGISVRTFRGLRAWSAAMSR